MVNIKTLIAAALLSSVAAVSFAQVPAVAKTVKVPTPAAVTAPADTASAPTTKKVKKHAGMKHKKSAVMKKADAVKPAASAAK